MALSSGLSRATERQIDLTTAVCQERLLTTHVRHLLAMVELTAERIPFDDAMDMYVRIMQLTPEQARNVGSRALAEIGRRSDANTPADLSFLDAEEEEREEERRDSGHSDAVFSRLRRRIRGRVHDDLRRRIDLIVARAEDAIFDTHVENALTFVKALKDEVSASRAIDAYLDVMATPQGEGNVIYHRALRIVADRVLPPVAGAEAPASGPPNLAHGG